MGFWRSLYYMFGWVYPKDEWCERQRQQKYLVIKQIQNTKSFKFKIPPPPENPPELEDDMPPLERIKPFSRNSSISRRNKKRKRKIP
jgi:hypothetical protein